MPNLTYLAHDDLVDTWPTPLTVGLLIAAPNPDGSGVVEPDSADGYARQPVTFSSTRAEGITTLKNSIPIVFGPSTGSDWDAVNYFGLFDANGDLRVYGRLRTQRTATVGEAITFPTNDLTIRLR